jgi:uncharacterized protein YecE (DUF72 family)
LINVSLGSTVPRAAQANFEAGGTWRVGTAGWSIPSKNAPDFCEPGTHLQRYAKRLNAVEINSSFYRPHREATYRRWAESVPKSFRFAVKAPREITHECALVDYGSALARFAAEVAGLGEQLGVILVQLPPSLAYEAQIARRFFRELRARFTPDIGIACEPRHRSWLTPHAEELLTSVRVARVAADPARAIEDAKPGGFRELAYFRLHGSPHIYYSNYDSVALARIGADLAASAAQARSTWCIFDNTAAQAALGNAMALQAMAPQLA